MLSLRRLPVVLFLLAALPVLAQTTGSISGRVSASMSLLPGVTVEGKSPALQGSRVAVTNYEGIYHLSLLPPGTYTVTFALSGFAPKASTIVVVLGKEATLDAGLSPSMSQTITVGEAAPLVNETSATLGTNLSAAVIESLPTQRNYSSVVQVTPGVSSDGTD
ncbi:MAG TPA: carboxypeptidase-like regulatory domain-containing protein, partial [Thermoanaerobaculia bacterium]|nr:carboxypeptidase-like regulatory domain-containing protein [Thermoanaerobaculia bacterium]